MPATDAAEYRDPIAEALASDRPAVSFEFFPPKDDEGEEQLWRTIADLAPLEPTFVSVTYGAGGSSRDRTVRITERIARESTTPPVGHLTLVGQSRAEIELVLKQYVAAGVRHLLALRGDPADGPRAPCAPPPHALHHAPWEPHPDGMDLAIELVELARETGGLSIGVAAFPEGHPDAPDRDTDADVLVAKARAGAEFAITQMFFRARDYFELVERVRA